MIISHKINDIFSNFIIVVSQYINKKYPTVFTIGHLFLNLILYWPFTSSQMLSYKGVASPTS